MILGINSADATAKIPAYKRSFTKLRDTKNTANTVTNPNNTELSGVPKSYITFRASEDKTDLNFTDDAKEILEDAKNIAITLGHGEITPEHVIEAEIQHTVNLAKDLPKELIESGGVENLSAMTKLAKQYSGKNMMETENSRDYLFGAMQDLQENNADAIKAMPTVETDGNIKLSDKFDKKLRELNTPYLDSYMLLGTAFNTISADGTKYPVSFLEDMQSYTFYKTTEEINKDYMPAYDKRAIDVWNKLALGSNLNVTFEDKKEADRLVASLIETVNAQKYGNFNQENTIFFTMSDSINDVGLLKEIEMIKEGTPEENKIITVNMDQLLVNSQATNEKDEITGVVRLSQIINSKDDGIKLVLCYSNDVYYKLVNDPSLGAMFKNYLTYSIPPIQTYEAKEIITDDMLKDIKTPFSKEAKDRVIFHAANMQGVFPDKALDLMKRISSYYGNQKQEIASGDVDEFAQIAYELFDKSSQKQGVVYDTGKTLDRMYGKETTKKDIEAIIRQIKTGNIGTRGIVIYSRDPEAGSGRKYTAETIAGEAKVPFVSINTADFADSERDEDNHIVETPKNAMKRVFSEAKKAARQNPYKTAILYVSDFEQFAFSGPYLPGYKQAMSQLTTEMEKAVNEDVNIVVIGSTDEYYADAIPMVARGFSQSIVVDSPAFNKKARREILANRIKDTNLPVECKKDEDFNHMVDKLVMMTEYMSFVEIKSLVDKTKQIMYERGKDKASMGDFIEAYLQLSTGRTSHPEMPDYNKRATTSHECGHATNLEVMGDILARKGEPWHQSHEVNFITLDPRGNFLGAVFENRKENSDLPFEALFTSIVCAYGGYSCEKAFFNMDGSSGISSDLAQAAGAAKRGIEYFGLGYNTGKISNAVGIKSGKYNENVFNDMDVILTNAQIVSDMITDGYKEFNKWFTEKYSKLIGTDECMVDGDDFRKALKKWKSSLSTEKKADLEVMDDIIMDVIKSTKNGKKYFQVKKVW